MGMVLGRRAYHSGAANVDILDAHFIRAAARNRLLKGIKIDHQQIDGENTVVMHRVFVAGEITITKQSAMHHRMQRLNAAIHHLWKLRQLTDIFDRNTRR